jgi:DegV family protein with EDD domain
MEKIALVAESTSSFFDDHIGNVRVYPIILDIHWDGKSYKDGVDLTTAQFYAKLKTTDVMPKTSQPTPHAFFTLYQQMLADGYEIISIHTSKEISGTVDSARQAKAMIGEDAPIEIIDSRFSAMLLKMLMVEAAEAIEGGKNLQEVAAHVRDTIDHCGIYFTVNTLEFLQKNGRLSTTQAVMGNLLQIRPILTFTDGKIVSIQKARTFKSALKVLKSHVYAAVEGKQIRSLAVTYCDNQKFIEGFLEDVISDLGIERPEKCCCDPLSPVVGTHTGPGSVGIAFITD